MSSSLPLRLHTCRRPLQSIRRTGISLSRSLFTFRRCAALTCGDRRAIRLMVAACKSVSSRGRSSARHGFQASWLIANAWLVVVNPPALLECAPDEFGDDRVIGAAVPIHIV